MGPSSAQALEENIGCACVSQGVEIISTYEMGSEHSQQVRLLSRFWDFLKTTCPSPCCLGQERSADPLALGWPWMPGQQGPLGACQRGQGLLTDTYIRSSFCCLRHISKYINQHFLPAMTMEKKCIHVHCLAGFHPVSVENLSSKEDGPAVFSDLNPCKCFYSYSADDQQSFQKIPQNQPHYPCPQAAVYCPTE